MRRCVGLAAGLAMVVAWAGWLAAGEGKERKGQGGEVTGAFVAAELAGESVTWKVTNEADQAEKSFEMPAKLVVQYSERNGANRVTSLRPVGKRAPAAKGNRLVAQGTFVKAEAQGKRVAVTISVEGDQGGERTFMLPGRLQVQYRERRGTVTVTSIGPAPRAKKEGAGEAQPDEGGEAKP